ncbi:Uncharacterised protein [Klebsiella pneumoniae]|nr:Uncharacterised protein [Klebsiella pneumoniae]
MKNTDSEADHRIIHHRDSTQYRRVYIQHPLPGAFGHLFRLRATVKTSVALPKLKPFGFVVGPYFPDIDDHESFLTDECISLRILAGDMS